MFCILLAGGGRLCGESEVASSSRHSPVCRPARSQARAFPLDTFSANAYHSNMHENELHADTVVETPATDRCKVQCFNEDLVRRLRQTMPHGDALEEARVVFAALADRTRLKVLHALKDGAELCLCDVAHVLGTSVSTASHNLRKLRDLRILKYRDDGKKVYYSLRDRFVSDLVAQVLRQVQG